MDYPPINQWVQKRIPSPSVSSPTATPGPLIGSPAWRSWHPARETAGGFISWKIPKKWMTIGVALWLRKPRHIYIYTYIYNTRICIYIHTYTYIYIIYIQFLLWQCYGVMTKWMALFGSIVLSQRKTDVCFFTAGPFMAFDAWNSSFILVWRESCQQHTLSIGNSWTNPLW